MDFGLSPEQQMLRDAVDRLLREHCPLDHVRKVAAGGNNVSAAVVAAMAELGLPGIVVGVAQLVELLVVVQAVVGSSPIAHPVPFCLESRGCGGTGRRARFRSWWGNPWRFESSHPHFS